MKIRNIILILILFVLLFGSIFYFIKKSSSDGIKDTYTNQQNLDDLALINFNSPYCDNIASKIDQVDCKARIIYELAFKNKNPDECHNFGSDSDGAYTCIVYSVDNLSATHLDSSYCSYLDEKDQERCINKVLLLKEDLANDPTVSIKTLNLAKCDSIKDNKIRDNCKGTVIFGLALKNKNPDECYKLGSDSDGVYICIVYSVDSLSATYLDSSYCSYLDEIDQERCINRVLIRKELE